jgi:hypothetical protein
MRLRRRRQHDQLVSEGNEGRSVHALGEDVGKYLLLAYPQRAYVSGPNRLAKAMDARADVAECTVDLVVYADNVGEGRVFRQDRVQEIETRAHDVAHKRTSERSGPKVSK